MRVNGTTQCSGDDSSPPSPGKGLATLQIEPVWTKRNHPRHVIQAFVKRADESSQVADFTLWWFIFQRGGFLRSLCEGLNDKRFWFGCYKFKCTTTPARGAGWRQICRRYCASSNGIPFDGYDSIIGTWRAAGCRPYVNVHRFSHYLDAIQ